MIDTAVDTASLIRALIAANSEKDAVITQQAREILRLTEENALMVEAVMRDVSQDWAEPFARSTERVH